MFVRTSLFTLTFLAALGVAHKKWWYQDPFGEKGFTALRAAKNDWWHQDAFGGQGFTRNPYYNSFQQMRHQIDAYGYATHVGHINRGIFSNPDLYTPRDRALGFQSDFNPGDSVNGAFHFVPKKQKVRATDGMIRAGLQCPFF